MLITGKAYWTNLEATNPQPDKYNPAGWSFDLAIDEATVKALEKKGVKGKTFRNKDDERGTFITLRRNAVKKNGEPSVPVEVVDANKNPWPSGKLIGNGSILNVIVSINAREFQGQKFPPKPSLVSAQVWELVEYNATEGGFPTQQESGVASEAETW